MKMKTLMMLTVLLTMLVAVPTFAQDPIPTSIWTNFAGFNTTINSQQVPVGSIITAYDPRSVLCGKFIVTSAGVYGAMNVYGNDGYGPGCLMGETVTFKINGIPATKNGSDDTYTGLGPIKILNLATAQSFSVAITGPSGKIGLLDSTVTYQVSVTNNGNGIDLIALDVTSATGWLVGGAIPAGVYFIPSETKNFDVTVKVPINATIGYQDTLSVKATSKFDGTANSTKKIVTTADNQTDVYDGNFAVPGTFTLNQNFPNPFNPETMISFTLEKPSEVTLAIYDILGRQVATVCQGMLPSGEHQYRWRGVDDSGIPVASGVYFYRLSSDQASITRKMAFIK